MCVIILILSYTTDVFIILFYFEFWPLVVQLEKQPNLNSGREGDKRQKHNPCLSGSLWRWHRLRRNTITTVTVTSLSVKDELTKRETFFLWLRLRQQSAECHLSPTQHNRLNISEWVPRLYTSWEKEKSVQNVHRSFITSSYYSES